MNKLIELTVNALNADCARRDLDPMTDEQIAALTNDETEALEMLDDMEARCGMDVADARAYMVDYWLIQSIEFKPLRDAVLRSMEMDCSESITVSDLSNVMDSALPDLSCMNDNGDGSVTFTAWNELWAVEVRSGSVY